MRRRWGLLLLLLISQPAMGHDTDDDTAAIRHPGDTGVAGPLPKFVLVAGFGGSGTRAAAMLLDTAGVFIASGGLECDDTDPKTIPYSACMRTTNDEDDDCSDQHLDWHFSHGATGDLAHGSGGSKGFCPSFGNESLPEGDANALSETYKSIVDRARTCTAGCRAGGENQPENKWKGTSITAVGLKDASTMFATPALAEWGHLTGVDVYVLLVIRDGRDLVLGDSGGASDSIKRAKKSLSDEERLFPGNLDVHAWSEMYKQTQVCMKSLLGPRVVPMRMEDFAVESVTARKAAAAKVLLQLNLRFDDALLGELAHVFAVPMDAPADFLQSEYGRWQHALTTEEEKQAYFDAAKPALEAFGYTMGMGADQYKVFGVDHSAELPAMLARAASADYPSVTAVAVTASAPPPLRPAHSAHHSANQGVDAAAVATASPSSPPPPPPPSSPRGAHAGRADPGAAQDVVADTGPLGSTWLAAPTAMAAAGVALLLLGCLVGACGAMLLLRASPAGGAEKAVVRVLRGGNKYAKLVEEKGGV